MEFNLEAIKLSLVSLLGFFASFIGETKKHIIALVILMIIDTIFGWIKGFKKGIWVSKKAKWGIAGKIAELILVLLLYVLNWAFQIDFIVYLGLYYFMVVELASIIENYLEINHNLPEGILEVLRKLQFNFSKLILDKIKIFLDKTFTDEDIKNGNK